MIIFNKYRIQNEISKDGFMSSVVLLLNQTFPSFVANLLELFAQINDLLIYADCVIKDRTMLQWFGCAYLFMEHEFSKASKSIFVWRLLKQHILLVRSNTSILFYFAQPGTDDCLLNLLGLIEAESIGAI